MIGDIASISPCWLSDVLGHALAAPQLRVDAVHADALSLNAAYNAQIFRLHITYASGAPDAPHTLIAKMPRKDPGMAENARVFQPGTKEAWFYANAASRCGVAVPRCFFASADRTTGQASFLLEDLGALEATPQHVGMSEGDAALALHQAAQLHGRWWNRIDDPVLAGLRKLMGNSNDSVNQVDSLYAEAWPVFDRNARFDMPPAVLAFGDSLIGRGARIAALAQDSPQTLMHGDYRVDNLLFTGTGKTRRVTVLDWESVDLGCGLGDVGWLIAGCVSNLTVEAELQLIESYHSALQSHGVADYSFDTCVADYRRCMPALFVQGVLSGTIWDPGGVDDHDAAFATAIGARFVAAAERLALWQLL